MICFPKMIREWENRISHAFKKNKHRHAVALSANYLFHFWGRQIYVDKISKKLIRYQSMIYFADDLSNNSIYYNFWSSFMMIIREIRWEREWRRRYQLYLQYFSIRFRNSREISITFWWIININFNFKSIDLVDLHLMKSF